MTTTKYKFFSIIFIAAVLPFVLCGCSGGGNDTQNVRRYDVMILSPTSRELHSVYSATIRGKQDIDIRPKVSGYITDIMVREGSVVRKGQPLFVIDQAQYEAELQTAKANVDVARAVVDAAALTLDSKEELYRQKIISEFDLQMARTALSRQKAELAQAKARETNARNNFEYTIVKSPADGVIGTLPFRVGALVSPSDATPLTSVSDNSEMYVYFSMAESQVLALTRRYGSLDNAISQLPEVSLQLSDGSVYEHTGRIEAISGILDATTGTVSLRAKFPNRNRLLLSGGSGNILLPHRQEDCCVIPQSATFEVQDMTYAFKYSGGKAKATIVSVFGISDGKEYVVQSGLAPGDTIIVEGVGLLKDGAPAAIDNIVEE